MSLRHFLCWAMILMLVLVSGCGVVNWLFPDDDERDPDEYWQPGEEQDSTGNTRGYTLYVLDMYGRFVVPVTYPVPWQEGIARAVLSHLVEGGPIQRELESQGLRAPLPAGTQIRGMTIRDGLCIVDFSGEFINTVDRRHEEMILDAVTYTLTEFATVAAVTIWVEGQPLTRMPHGTIVAGVMSRERGVNAIASAKATGAAVTVYRRLDSLAGGRLLVPITTPVAATADPVVAALTEMLKEEEQFYLESALPSGVRVINLQVEGDMAVVDFSSELLAADDLKLAVDAIVLTLTELNNIAKVRVTIQGQDISLPDGTILSEPIFRPSTTNPLAF